MAEVKIETAEKPAAAKKETASNKTVTYRCVNKCFWDNKLFKEGDEITVDGKVKVPEHFIVVK